MNKSNDTSKFGHATRELPEAELDGVSGGATAPTDHLVGTVVCAAIGGCGGYGDGGGGGGGGGTTTDPIGAWNQLLRNYGY
jgi:hypothetical protein